MALPTIPIKYHVWLGDPRLLDVEGAVSSFTFTEQAPAVLCGQVPGTGDHIESDYRDTLSRFVHALGVSHTKDMLLTRQFKCTICPRPATSTVGCYISFLSPQSGCEPSIRDLQAPVCVTAGICDGKARRILQEVITSLIPPQVELKNAGPEGCRTCGTTRGNLKLCAGCRSISYCSKECQAKNWAYHKAVCKIIRMERAMHEATGGVPMENLSVAEIDRAFKAGRDAGGITTNHKSFGDIERDLQATLPPGMKLKLMTAHEAAAAGYNVKTNDAAEDSGSNTSGGTAK
ncbi:hypothetical protein ONS95_004644 [Cadophora gregata]|uniref:uncharacterized protein n=1 Tax=Cadophora gregata TaxID=51156 RepID=UPI0026DC7CF6|nr:uncharacterized protein ONS95_004644 [Cadophora gregata]KAK0104986.1 hypothetical protein ONS96_004394 [Cadophora gregata f. sp. sojae]KAK0106142.1 hypothetical protein ONS95_004644 [Cadophora gregata]